MKYVLMAEDGRGDEYLWGRCADAEGLFADPVPPQRERLTFRACTPLGPLVAAVGSPGGEGARLGDLCLEVWNDERPLEWWGLTDAVVVAVHPSEHEPSLIDIVLEAGVEEPESGRVVPSASAHYMLFRGDDSLIGSCREVDGLSAERSGPMSVPVTVTGCESTDRLFTALGEPGKPGRLELWALDRTGRPMAKLPLAPGAVTRASSLGHDLIDLDFNEGLYEPMPLHDRPVWDVWYQGVPTTPNQWAPFGSENRAAWLGMAFNNRRTSGDDQSGGTYHLDGRFVTDKPGLHCAMGEAIFGPGGYFGRDWQGFSDCLSGGFGVSTPFTLVWRNAETARRALADVMDNPGRQISYFEEIVELLERYGVAVVLE
ncbi:barstar family protein [Streptomyces sp. NPDC060064]|uniref:barstar family protein n=1 Tax=Streptomyces sp. NPDC060064 TaxID=3347049 RepID=UPI0036ADBDB1